MSTATFAPDLLVIANISEYNVTVLARIVRELPGGDYQVRTTDALRLRQADGSIQHVHILYTTSPAKIQPLPADQQHINPELLIDLYRAALTPTGRAND